MAVGSSTFLIRTARRCYLYTTRRNLLWDVSKEFEHYAIIFGHFETEVLRGVRRGTYGSDDFGQNSWLSRAEFGEFVEWLHLSPDSHVLDVGCGSGGPALLLAKTVACRVTGIDINDHAIAAAEAAAAAKGLGAMVRFRREDARQDLPFEEGAFDAVLCIDSINHLPNRSGLLMEWRRILKPDGRVLFTDPTVVTGPLSGEEIAHRSLIGHLEFSPPGLDEELLGRTGFDLVLRKDVTENIATLSKRRYEARAAHRDDLLRVEGETRYDLEQRFYAAVHKLARDRRLSRFVFVGRKPRR